MLARANCTSRLWTSAQQAAVAWLAQAHHLRFCGDRHVVDTQGSELIARVVRIVEGSLAAEGANPH